MKKIICTLMVMLVVFCFFACGESGELSDSQTKNTDGRDQAHKIESSRTQNEAGSQNEEKNKSYTEGGSATSRTKLPEVSEYTDRLDNSLKVRRSMLNNVEKELYDQFLPYVLSYTPFTVDYTDVDYEPESLHNAINAIKHDYPETWLYFTGGSRWGTVEENGKTYQGYVSYSSKFFYLEWNEKGLVNFSKKSISDYIANIDSVCDSILAQMPKKLSVKEKYVWLADYVCSITEYDYSDSDNYLYADGPLLYGKGICQSYAYAYQWLCQKAGLWCAVCNGMTADVGGHCWNVVKLDDGKTYYMDLTWADGAKDPNEHYFMSYAKCAETRTPNAGEWIADGTVYTGEDMNPLSLVVAVIFALISWWFTKNVAPFEMTSKLKYVTINNKFLARCLIPKQTGYVKVNDRKRISLFSFVFFLLFAILVLALALLLVLPDIPCEEFVASFGRRGHTKWTINTLNEKLIYLLPILFFFIELIAFFSMGIPRIIKDKTESKKSLCGLLAVYILLIVLLVFLVFQLF